MSSQHNSIPIAKGSPLIGSALPLLKNPLAFLKQQYKEHGSIFRVKAANRDMVVLAGLHANQFASEEGKDCLISREFWGELVDYWDCPHFISALDGDAHIEERRAFKPTMSRQIAADNQGGLIDVIHNTIEQYQKKNAFASVRSVTRTLTNSELYLLLTGSHLSLDPSIGHALAEYQRMTFNVLVLQKWPKLMLYTPQYAYYRSRSKAFVKHLKETFDISPPESGFFKIILDRHQQSNRSAADLDFMLLAPFWAGLDTLGAGLTFLIQELTKKPFLQTRIRAEISAAMKEEGSDQIPSIDKLRNLPDLFGLCMEILRVYPVAFGNGRTAAKDFDFEGYTIRKGQQILLFTSATHFDDQYYNNPEDFDIGRYSEPRNEHRQRYAFNPFGRGPHICLGASMAEGMLLTTAACLIYDYEIAAQKPHKDYGMIFDPSPTLPYSFKACFKRISHGE